MKLRGLQYILPFLFLLLPALNPGKAFAYGRGLQPKGQRVKEECIFYVDTKEAGEAELKVQIIGPGELGILGYPKWPTEKSARGWTDGG